MACGNLVLHQGWNPRPLQWKRRVLTTGPPGKSLYCCFCFRKSYSSELTGRDRYKLYLGFPAWYSPKKTLRRKQQPPVTLTLGQLDKLLGASVTVLGKFYAALKRGSPYQARFGRGCGARQAGGQCLAQTAPATFKPRRRIRPGPEVLGAGGREGVAASRAAAAAARTRSRGLGLGLESQLGSRGPAGPGAGGLRGGGSGGGGRPWRRVCLSRGRSLGAGGRGQGRTAEEGCGSAEAVATGTRRHHLSRRGAAAGTARRYPSRPGRCPSPAAVPAAAVVACSPPLPRDSPALEPSGLLPHLGTLLLLGPGPPLPRCASRPPDLPNPSSVCCPWEPPLPH